MNREGPNLLITNEAILGNYLGDAWTHLALNNPAADFRTSLLIGFQRRETLTSPFWEVISYDFALHEIDFKLTFQILHILQFTVAYISRFITKYSLLSSLQLKLEDFLNVLI